MATQTFVDTQSSSQQMMNLTRLQFEVSNGTYKFTRPLTIVTCATKDKYIVYASCAHCLKGVQRQNNRFALRVLLSDWIGSEVWATVFNETAAKVLGFSANNYVAMTSDEVRYAALSVLQGASVMATIKKRVKDMYAYYTVSELEVIDGSFSL